MEFLELFYQGCNDGIPSHWCVKYLKENAGYVSYAYFHTEEESLEWIEDTFYNNLDN